MIPLTEKKAKAGVMVCGHREYWPQFPDLKAELLAVARDFETLIEKQGIEVINYTNGSGDWMVDNPEDGYRAGVFFKQCDIDILFCLNTSYVASGRYVIGLKQLDCPVIIAGYQKKVVLENVTTREGMVGCPCSLPEIYNAMTRSGINPAGLVYGCYEAPGFDAAFSKDVAEWCRVARALRAYKGAIFGHMGHSYDGMYDMNFDPTTFTRTFGIHIKMIEMCEFVSFVNSVTDSEIRDKVRVIKDTFEFCDPSYDPATRKIEDEDLEWTARVSCGMDRMVKANGLSGMAYYYEGLDNEYERIACSMVIGNSLLVSQGIPFAGESDMKTCLAMYTTGALGFGGSFAEMWCTVFDENIQMIGHDGPHDMRIADGKPLMRALKLFHGKKGTGLSVEFSIKHGPITLLGLSSDINGQYSFSVAEGESTDGPLPQVGNTFSRGYFGNDVAGFVRDWAQSGINHHFSLSVGHNASVIKKLATALHIPFKQIR